MMPLFLRVYQGNSQLFAIPVYKIFPLARYRSDHITISTQLLLNTNSYIFISCQHLKGSTALLVAFHLARAVLGDPNQIISPLQQTHIFEVTLLQNTSTTPHSHYYHVSYTSLMRQHLSTAHSRPRDGHHPIMISVLPQTSTQDTSSCQYLKERQFVIPDNLSSRQLANRTALLSWWITTARDCLQLKYRTIDIAIKLFDYYCYLKHQQNPSKECKVFQGSKRLSKTKRKGEHILDCRDESNLTATACFFSTAKFNEIYPPSLNDFVYFDEDKLSKQAVVLREVDIIEVTKCGYTKAIISDWFALLSQSPLPDWAYRCYLYAPYATTQQLASAIYRVVESTSEPNQPECLVMVLELVGVRIPGVLEKVRGKRHGVKK